MTVAKTSTHGFLFADLRDYSAFVEEHGDYAAAELLARYRRLVRSAIAEREGAEVRTEGDSFYVVFPSASSAVIGGMAILAAAAAAEPPIRVGVGVHAGETADTAEGLVGSAVNIAARVCAQAAAGELLATDTVRTLTRTLVPFRFIARGTPPLKGIAEPITLFRVADPDDPEVAAAAARTDVIVTAPRTAAAPGDRPWVRAAVVGGALVIVVVTVLATVRLAGGTGRPGATASTGAGASLAPVGSPSPIATGSSSSGLTITLGEGLDENPFGSVFPLASGRYTAVYLPGSPMLTMTDDGWSVFDTQTERLTLSRTTSPSDTLRINWLEALTSDSCGQKPLVAVGTEPETQFLAWANAQPALRVSAGIPRQFGDLTTTELDVSVLPKDACPYNVPPSVEVSAALLLNVGERLRLEVSSWNDRLILIVIDASSAADFDTFDPLAEQVLGTLRFEPGSTPSP